MRNYVKLGKYKNYLVNKALDAVTRVTNENELEACIQTAQRYYEGGKLEIGEVEKIAKAVIERSKEIHSALAHSAQRARERGK